MAKIRSKSKQLKPLVKKKVFVAMSPYKSIRDSAGQAGGAVQKKVSVFVAMSGGVDSSVAALLLKKQGYDVTGVYMKNWSEESMGGKFAKYCPWRQDVADVRAVCKTLRIPLKVYNFEKEYNRKVINYFFDEEKKGLTPNPDVVCNREIKFGLFLKKALADGADFIATGHYARLKSNLPHPASSHPLPDGRGNRGEAGNKPERYIYQLLQARDINKDQTYFLCLLKQKQISRSLFPLGDLTKPEVRELARKASLPTAEKPESMGICFVGEVKLEDFLKARIAEKPGAIVTADGKIVGKHKGLAFYTIGQRKGLELGGGDPYFVIDKDSRHNRLIVAQGAENPELFRKGILLNHLSWTWLKPPKFPLNCKVRIRHRQDPQNALIKKFAGRTIVEFVKKQRAVTPGQYCAIYKNQILLGGGVIVSSLGSLNK